MITIEYTRKRIFYQWFHEFPRTIARLDVSQEKLGGPRDGKSRALKKEKMQQFLRMDFNGTLNGPGRSSMANIMLNL